MILLPSNHTNYYFNDAATSWPKAPGVAEAVYRAIDQPPVNPGRDGGKFEVLADRCPLGPAVRECRSRLALHLGVPTPTRIGLCNSVTHALNLAIWGIGLTLPRGVEVITSVAEHNSVLRPLRHLQKWHDVKITTIDLDAQDMFDMHTFDRALAQGAAFVILSHASNITGHLYDVAPLFARAKAAGAITLLDASQTMGHVPVHPKELHADLVAFPGHKGLRGPVGVGGLYVAPDIELEPVFVGGTGGQSALEYQPEEMPTRLEAGTPNTPAIAGLNAALRWHEQEGETFIRTERLRADQLRQGLREIPGVRLYDDHPEAEYVPVLSFRLDGLSVEEAGQRFMDEYHIICRTGLHCAPLMHQALGTFPEGTIRFSVSGFTTEEEIHYVLESVRQLAHVPALA